MILTSKDNLITADLYIPDKTDTRWSQNGSGGYVIVIPYDYENEERKSDIEIVGYTIDKELIEDKIIKIASCGTGTWIEVNSLYDKRVPMTVYYRDKSLEVIYDKQKMYDDAVEKLIKFIKENGLGECCISYRGSPEYADAPALTISSSLSSGPFDFPARHYTAGRHVNHDEVNIKNYDKEDFEIEIALPMHPNCWEKEFDKELDKVKSKFTIACSHVNINSSLSYNYTSKVDDFIHCIVPMDKYILIETYDLPKDREFVKIIVTVSNK